MERPWHHTYYMQAKMQTLKCVSPKPHHTGVKPQSWARDERISISYLPLPSAIVVLHFWTARNKWLGPFF